VLANCVDVREGAQLARFLAAVVLNPVSAVLFAGIGLFMIFFAVLAT